MDDTPNRQAFHVRMLPHLDAAYNLARWMAGNADDAADIVQESCVKALRFFKNYRGGSAKAWLLKIVRNTALTFLSRKAGQQMMSLSQENGEGETALLETLADEKADMEGDVIQKQAAQSMDELIDALPVLYRDIVILREVEELSYKEIAFLTGLPMGTVMSRLARARESLQQHWKRLGANRGAA